MRMNEGVENLYEEDGEVNMSDTKMKEVPSRQTIWRHKRKLEKQQEEERAFNYIENQTDDLETESSDPESENLGFLIQEGYNSWPRLTKARRERVKYEICTDGIRDLRCYLKSKKCKLQGLDLERHMQVLELIRFQKLRLTKKTWCMPRMEIATIVVAVSAKGHWVALQILAKERKWIKS
ncbi:hypothetical protein HOY80DRAFT_1038553 [Tuber brumale]|nr:hypothetical protein HOY80DRAFT_1038553 [Tuber brumale]